jgi:hypothetical protein
MSDTAGWDITDHACRRCLGRILSRHTDGGETVVECANCGLTAVGDPATICGCGMKRGKYAQLRCVRLDRPVPGVAAQVVVMEVEQPAERQGASMDQNARSNHGGSRRDGHMVVPHGEIADESQTWNRPHLAPTDPRPIAVARPHPTRI